MKVRSFEEFLLERLEVPNEADCKGKMRHSLPQIHNFDGFCSDLAKEDIALDLRHFDPDKLTPTQSNFNEEKVDRMVAENAWNSKPIIVSKDMYVVDGHHRWLAACKTKTKVAARVVGLTCDELLAFLKDKPYCEKRGINE